MVHHQKELSLSQILPLLQVNQ
ncbi:hypothetical protein [Ligilactobacillus saerimneri]